MRQQQAARRIPDASLLASRRLLSEEAEEFLLFDAAGMEFSHWCGPFPLPNPYTLLWNRSTPIVCRNPAWCASYMMHCCARAYPSPAWCALFVFPSCTRVSLTSTVCVLCSHRVLCTAGRN